MTDVMKHTPDEIVRSCWNCRHGVAFDLASGGMCHRDDAHPILKQGVEPCEDYALDTRWLYCDWIDYKRLYAEKYRKAKQ